MGNGITPSWQVSITDDRIPPCRSMYQPPPSGEACEYHLHPDYDPRAVRRRGFSRGLYSSSFPDAIGCPVSKAPKLTYSSGGAEVGRGLLWQRSSGQDANWPTTQ